MSQDVEAAVLPEPDSEIEVGPIVTAQTLQLKPDNWVAGSEALMRKLVTYSNHAFPLLSTYSLRALPIQDVEWQGRVLHIHNRPLTLVIPGHVLISHSGTGTPGVLEFTLDISLLSQAECDARNLLIRTLCPRQVPPDDLQFELEYSTEQRYPWQMLVYEAFDYIHTLDDLETNVRPFGTLNRRDLLYVESHVCRTISPNAPHGSVYFPLKRVHIVAETPVIVK